MTHNCYAKQGAFLNPRNEHKNIYGFMFRVHRSRRPTAKCKQRNKQQIPG